MTDKLQPISKTSHQITIENLSNLQNALDACTTISEVKNVRNTADAFGIYAKRFKLLRDIQNKIGAIKLNAEYKAGKMLLKDVKAGNPQLSNASTIGLDKIGISRDLSSKWQQIASIPEEKFKKFIEDCIKIGEELTTAKALRHYTFFHSQSMKVKKEKKVKIEKENHGNDFERFIDYLKYEHRKEFDYKQLSTYKILNIRELEEIFEFINKLLDKTQKIDHKIQIIKNLLTFLKISYNKHNDKDAKLMKAE